MGQGRGGEGGGGVKKKHVTQKQMAEAGRLREAAALEASRLKRPGFAMQMHLMFLRGLREGMSEFRPRARALKLKNSRQWLQREMQASRREWHLEKGGAA